DVLRDRAVVHVAMAGIDVDRMLRIPEGDPIAHYCPPARPRRADYRATVAARQSVVSGPSVPCTNSRHRMDIAGLHRGHRGISCALQCRAPCLAAATSKNERIYFADTMISGRYSKCMVS